MKHWIAGIILAAALVTPAVTSAQPSPDMRAKMQQIFTTAKTNAFAALTPDHRARVTSVVGQLNAGTIGRREAADQIDGFLSPSEKTAVLDVEKKAFADMRAARTAANPNAAVPAPGGPPPGGAPGGPPGGRMAPDAGRFLVILSRPPRRGTAPQARSSNAP